MITRIGRQLQERSSMNRLMDLYGQPRVLKNNKLIENDGGGKKMRGRKGL